MIIKSKPIKTLKNLERVLRYCINGRDVTKDDFVYTQFIRGDRKLANQIKNPSLNSDERSIIQETQIQNMKESFVENNKKREIPRINGNIAYHEIVSFNERDTNKLDNETLLKVAQKYIYTRSKNSLVVCALHSSKHRHLHFLISSTEYASGIVLHKTKSDFSKMKIELEKWQDKELRLTHSRVNHSKKALIKDSEYQINLRGALSEKQKLGIILSKTYYKSSSSISFYKNLESQGINLYERGRKKYGIVGFSRKYRFKTMGYSEERILLLDNPQFKREKELKLLREIQINRKSLNKNG